MDVIRAADCRVMPWKNGGGSTTEIAIYPPASELDEFHWRVSMATVGSDGPFSPFPNIDRTLTVLEGAGIDLFIGTDAPVTLTTDSPPFDFPGDVPTVATLLEGEIRDFNVMSHRDHSAHSVKRVEVAGHRQLPVNPPTVLLFCETGEIEVRSKGESFTLGRHDAVLAELRQPDDWRLFGDGRVLMVEIAVMDPEY
jgi:environmental stress-induced protein Ves